MIDLTVNQYHLVENILLFTSAAMGVTSVFFMLQRGEVLPRYRVAITILGLVALVSTFNYVSLYLNWHGAFTVVKGVVQGTSSPFDDTHRYSGWLLTIPLLLVALVLVLDLAKRQARLRSLVLAMLAAEIVVLGFPWQASPDAASRWLWWAIAMVPFTLIVFQLFGNMAKAVKAQPDEARKLTVAARFLMVTVLAVYPAIYLLPLAGLTGSMATVVTQVSFAVTDLLTGGLCGILIYMIASSKTLPGQDLVSTHASMLRGLKV